VSIGHTSDTFPGNAFPNAELSTSSPGVDDDRLAAANSSHVGKPYAVLCRELPTRSGWFAEAAYRLFEILVAAFGLLLFLPLMLLEAAIVRLDSPGPILFIHRRPARSVLVRGRDLEHHTDLRPPPEGYQADLLYFVPNYFKLAKFRTMHVDARTRFPELYSYKFDPEDFHRQMPTLRNDPRVTRAGRILRRLSIDELPNLWSVLIGDMRLVGPRPEAPEVLQYYTYEEMYKFACKPGITGLAQINGRGLLNWGETISWDIEYVRTRSVMLDLKILAITLKQVLFRHGAF